MGGRAAPWTGGAPGSMALARPHAGTDSSSSRLDLHRRRSTGRYMNGGRPGSVLAQKLVGAPLPLITCDDCPKKVLRRVSTTPEHPGWVFIKCSTDGVCATLASVVLSDLTSCANLKFYCVEWMQVLVLGRRVHRYIDRAQFSRCCSTFS